MKTSDYYQVLGVPRDATYPALRHAYVRLARRHHPDTAGNLPARLREVQQAYRCLSDPMRRADYDRELAGAEHAYVTRQRKVQRRLWRYDQRRAPKSIRAAVPRSRWLLTLSSITVLLFAALVLALLV